MLGTHWWQNNLNEYGMLGTHWWQNNLNEYDMLGTHWWQNNLNEYGMLGTHWYWNSFLFCLVFVCVFNYKNLFKLEVLLDAGVPHWYIN